jgi:arylsulfatase A-like enzyme
MDSSSADPKIRPGAPAWLLAGWWGVVVGLFDAAAAFLHPVSLPVLPFAVTVYGIGTILLYLLLRSVLRLLPKRVAGTADDLALAAVVGLTVLFFAAYAVTTSTLPLLTSRIGMLLGLVLALAIGIAAGLGVLRRRRRRARSSEDGGAAVRPRQRRWLMTGLALAVVLSIYPILGGIFLLRDGRRGPPGGAPPRGFVLVSLDAARGDRISGLGYPRPTTPALDQLIATGTAFRRAYVQQPASAPGHACMLTGLPPLAHGVVANTNVLSEDVLTAAERLRAAGFHTAAFINNFYLDSRFGFAQGFEWFVNQYRASRLADLNPLLLLRGLSAYHAWHRLAHKPGAPTDDTIACALSWLRHRPSGDFFIFLHIMDPHSPYDPPPDLRERFYQPQGAPVRDTVQLRKRLDSLTSVEVAALQDLYDGDVALADRKLGRLVAALRQLGLLDSTLLVVTADHGEVLYEKGRTFDHGLIHQGDLHVPLVFHRPGRIPGGLVVEQPVSSTALVSTAFAVLGVPYADQTGVGFYPPLLAAADDASELAPAGGPSRPVFSITGVREMDLAAALDEQIKVVVQEGEILDLYDLTADSTEQNDLWADLGSDGTGERLRRRAGQLRDLLQDWLDLSREHSVGLSVQQPAAVDRETRRRLQALGYVD